MNDDSRPTDQARTLKTTVTVPADEVDARSIDVTGGISEEDLRLLDAVNHELALDASNDPRPNTPEEDEADADLLARAQRTMSMAPEQVARDRRARRVNRR